MATATNVLCVIMALAMFGAIMFNTWFYTRLLDAAENRFQRERGDWSIEIHKKDSRIAELDADYKALVESYIRETGKVFIRPVPQTPDRLSPAQPSPWRMKPPPPWSPTDAQDRERGKQG